MYSTERIVGRKTLVLHMFFQCWVLLFVGLGLRAKGATAVGNRKCLTVDRVVDS